MIIDTHAHLNFNAFQKDAGEVIRRSLESGVWMINVGTGYTTSLRAKDLAQKYAEGVYGAVGLHPINLETGLVKIKTDPEETELETCEEKFDYAKYKDLWSTKLYCNRRICIQRVCTMYNNPKCINNQCT